MEKLLPMLIHIPIKIERNFSRDQCNRLFHTNGSEIWKMYISPRYANKNLGLLANFLNKNDKNIYYKRIESMNLINIKKLKELVATM